MLWNSLSIWLIISKYLYSSNPQTKIKEEDDDDEKIWTFLVIKKDVNVKHVLSANVTTPIDKIECGS